MIRFKCVYCGRKLTAKDEQRNKKAKCPECSHIVMVPVSTKGKRILDPDISESSQKMNEACAMFEIAHQKDYEDEDIPLGCEKPAWFVPTYDKLSLFLMSITFIILVAINPQVLQDIRKLINASLNSEKIGGIIIALLAVCLSGMGLSIYYIFSSKKTDDSHKNIMVTFAASDIPMWIAFISGFAAYHLIKYENNSGFLLIFPTWNLINTALILIMLFLKILNRNCIIDRDISFFRVVFSLILAISILLVCEYIFKMYWVITFSICMVYTTSFDRAIQNTVSVKLVTKE